MPNLWPRGTSRGQGTTQINVFDGERTTRCESGAAARTQFQCKTRQTRQKPQSRAHLVPNPAWTLLGRVKGILGAEAYIGFALISVVPARFAKTLRTRPNCKHCPHTRATCNHLFHTPCCDRFHDRKCIRADKRTASERSLSQQTCEKHATYCNNNGYLGRDARTKPQEWIQ